MPQTQTPARFLRDSDSFRFIATKDQYPGDIISVGDLIGICNREVLNGKEGVAERRGVIECPKLTGAMAAGVKVYWDPAGNPLNGTAGTGACTTVAGALKLLGTVDLAAAATDEFAKVVMI